MSRVKTTFEQRRTLREEVQKRIALVRQLASLHLKTIAARNGVSYSHVYRLDRRLRGLPSEKLCSTTAEIAE